IPARMTISASMATSLVWATREMRTPPPCHSHSPSSVRRIEPYARAQIFYGYCNSRGRRSLLPYWWAPILVGRRRFCLTLPTNGRLGRPGPLQRLLGVRAQHVHMTHLPVRPGLPPAVEGQLHVRVGEGPAHVQREVLAHH